MLLILAATIAAATPAVDAARAPCERPRASTVARTHEVPTIRPLDQMPPARQILGVLHEEGGCARPIVVHDQVGAPSRP